MAENDAKKKGKMIDSATDQEEGDSDDSVNQADPADLIKEEEAKKENLKKMSNISFHLNKDGGEGDDSLRLTSMNEDATGLMIPSPVKPTPMKRKEPTTSAKTSIKIRKKEHGTGPSKATTPAAVKGFHKKKVKVPKKGTKPGEKSSAVNSSDSDASSILLIEKERCSSPTTGLLPKNPPEADGKI